jgi:hypothetical protein
MWASGGWHATVLPLLQAAPVAMGMHSEMYCSAMHPRPLLLRSAGSLLAALLPLMRATRSLAGFPAAITINLSKHKHKHWQINLID